jgi:hypothetical protein
MSKLHELLAVENTTNDASNKMLRDAEEKFRKSAQYFEGFDKRLEMLVESDAKEAVELAGGERKELITTVQETLEYALAYYGKSEDVKFQINESNRDAVADIVINNEVLVKDVPINQLVGLESRLAKLRTMFEAIPTQNAAIEWVGADSALKGAVKTKEPIVTTKTDKKLTPIMLAPATDKHPAQVKEAYTDEVVGKFSLVKFSGAATSQQKADLMDSIDSLITAVKQARTRANNVEVKTRKISHALISHLMQAFSK